MAHALLSPDRMGSLWLDVRYALRMMAKSPGLTAVLAITLALGIGASTTIFSVVHSVVLSPLPYDRPEQLVRVHTEFHGELESDGVFPLSAPEYDDLRRACRSCESVAAEMTGTAAISGGEQPVRVVAGYLTHTMLPLLGVSPQLGRWFTADEDRPGDPTVVILGDAVWRRAFGADPGVIGRKIYVDAMPVTVIGVMPSWFDLSDQHHEAWLPANLDYTKRRAAHGARVIVRLAAGATLASFRAELAALTKIWSENKPPVADRTDRVQLHAQHHIHASEHPIVAVPLQADQVGSIATTLWMMQAAVLIVLLIAIVNIASLLLARSESRTREVAVRHALGASRRRLVRQFITESVILGTVGGALGIVVAMWGIDGVIALLPRSAPRAGEIELDVTAVVFAVACSMSAALLFGLAPILHARRTDLHGALKDGSPRSTGSRARLRVRRALVITEIALAVVLVIACTVMIRSFTRLQRIELGFAPDHLLTFELEIPERTYPGVTGDVFWRRLEDKLRALPGVSAATLTGSLPAAGALNVHDFEIVGRPATEVYYVDHWQFLGTAALETLGARLVRGRTILPSDTMDAPGVILVNEAFAAKFFPGVDPIGMRVRMDEPREVTIVGIVADIRQANFEQPAATEAFFPVWQAAHINEPPRSRLTLWGVVRTAGDPRLLAPAVQRAVAELDPMLPISHLRTMDDVLWQAVERPRFLTFLLTGFAGLALLLAAVGIYGVMAHTVAQRTHEIGLRVALGARPGQVRSMILRQAGELVAIGAGIGLAAAIALQLALGAQLTGLFYGDSLTQPLLLAGVAITVALAALLATWIPVRRATRIEPMAALRSE